MINTNSNDLAEVRKMGNKVCVNRLHLCIWESWHFNLPPHAWAVDYFTLRIDSGIYSIFSLRTHSKSCVAGYLVPLTNYFIKVCLSIAAWIFDWLIWFPGCGLIDQSSERNLNLASKFGSNSDQNHPSNKNPPLPSDGGDFQLSIITDWRWRAIFFSYSYELSRPFCFLVY